MKKKILTDYLYNVSYQLLIIILPIFTAPYASRVLGADGVGQHTFAYTVAHYFLIFALLGVNSYGSRSIAQVRNDKIKTAYVFSGIVYLQQMLSAIILLLYVIYAVFFAGQNRLLAAIQGLFVFSAALDINWFFFGQEQFKLTATRRILIRLISVSCVFIFVRERADLWVYSLIMTLDTLTSQGFLWIFILRFTHFVRVPMKDIFSHLKGMILLFVPSIATNIYRNLSKLLLGLLISMAAVGMFEYSEKIIMMFLGLLNALSTVMLPKMTALQSQNEELTGKRYLRGSMQFALFLACAVCFGYAAIAPVFSVVFFGPEFASAVNLMEGLSVSVLFIAWANVIRMQYLIPNNLEKVILKSTFSGLLVNLLAALLLIPRFGAFGAVMTTALTEFSVTFVQTIQVRKQLEVKRFMIDGLPFLAAGIVMFFLVRLVGSYFGLTLHGLLLQIAVGSLSFIFISMALLMINDNPIRQLINSSIRRIRVGK